MFFSIFALIFYYDAHFCLCMALFQKISFSSILEQSLTFSNIVQSEQENHPNNSHVRCCLNDLISSVCPQFKLQIYLQVPQLTMINTLQCYLQVSSQFFIVDSEGKIHKEINQMVPLLSVHPQSCPCSIQWCKLTQIISNVQPVSYYLKANDSFKTLIDLARFRQDKQIQK